MENKIQQRSAQLLEIEPKKDFIIEGYAALFEPYVLYEADGIKYYEEVKREAFENADLSDASLKIDHQGLVYARVRNGTLKYTIDHKGLYMKADLSTTEHGKELYNMVKQGLYHRMSWAFTVREDEYDVKQRKRTIRKVNKVYDFSVVDQAANSNTSVSARDVFTGEVAQQFMQELQERAALIRDIKRKVGKLTNDIIRQATT